MFRNEQVRGAAAAVLQAGSMQDSIASIRASIDQLLDPAGMIESLDSEEAFKVAWTVAATAGSLISGVGALLRSFEGLVPPQLIDDTRAIIARLGSDTDGSPSELLADRYERLAELELKLDLLSRVVRDRAARAPAGTLLTDSDLAALLA
jgi:hypothetical protein